MSICEPMVRCYGLTKNLPLLVNVPMGVSTVTKPVVAPLGTVVEIKDLETTLNVAAVRAAWSDLLKQKRPFTALMAFDDMTVFGSIRALAKAGLHVPEDCSVIGFDDVAASALYTPPLTTVRQPMEAMGNMAVSIVIEGINAVVEKREVSAVHRRLAPELAARESTRRLV